MEKESCLLHEKNILLRIRGVEQHVKAFMEIHEQATKFQNAKLERILEQTIKTNGRVTDLERDGGVEKIAVRNMIIDVRDNIREDIKGVCVMVEEKVGDVDAKVVRVRGSVVFWSWLTEKPYRLGAAVVGVVVLSRLITNDMVWELILKAF
jgi:hypothetical protein